MVLGSEGIAIEGYINGLWLDVMRLGSQLFRIIRDG